MKISNTNTSKKKKKEKTNDASDIFYDAMKEAQEIEDIEEMDF